MKKRIKKSVIGLFVIPLFMIGCTNNTNKINDEMLKVVTENIGEVEFSTEVNKDVSTMFNKHNRNIYTKAGDEDSIYKSIEAVYYDKKDFIVTTVTLNGIDFENLNFLLWIDDLHAINATNVDGDISLATHIEHYNQALNEAKTNVTKKHNATTGVGNVNINISDKYDFFGNVIRIIDTNETKITFATQKIFDN